MRVYFETKDRFIKDVWSGKIEEKILGEFQRVFRHGTSPDEMRAWHNSCEFMRTILSESKTPDSCGIALEFNVPNSNFRTDFIISGVDSSGKHVAIIIELKQWEDVGLEDSDVLVSAGFRDKPWRKGQVHPSYQAWSYAEYMRDTLENVQEEDVKLYTCSYLHNCLESCSDVLTDSRFSSFTSGAHPSPPFVSTDRMALIEFIDSHIFDGDLGESLNLLDKSKVRPSRNLMNCVGEIMGGVPQFKLIDDQVIAFEMILRHFSKTRDDNRKYVQFVKGGPGTGKSVIAINLMAQVISKYGMMSCYSTTNSTPRHTYEAMMKDYGTKKPIRELFVGNSSFVKECKKDYDGCSNRYALVLTDEAHRLCPKDTLFHSKIGQIQATIHVAKYAVFFIDEGQHVQADDDGSIEEIRKWANYEGAEVLPDLKLTTQFRCGGSTGYLDWLSSVLQKEKTIPFNYDLSYRDYDIRVLDDPQDILDLIREKNVSKENQARMVAGYCWNWNSKSDPYGNTYDIILGKKGFHMKWNPPDVKFQWGYEPKYAEYMGVVHTCQGLEFEYVGVILGPDIIYRNGKIICIRDAHPKSDTKTFSGIDTKFPLKHDKTAEIDRLIKNAYSVLMSRGKRGCFIYCCDPLLQEYFRQEITKFHENSYLDRPIR